ncbi:MAG: GNAT family N-acetyltransferase [Nodosilinea sp.]
MDIRFLNSQDIDAYRDLRLHALRESPTAFASSFEQEAQYPLTALAHRLHLDDDVNGVFGAFGDGDRLMGMLGFSRETRLKRVHIGTLWSMYVLPEFRGQGVGARLLDAAIAHACQLDGLRQLTLSITAGNVAAGVLYQSRGFEPFGLGREAMCIDGRYFDEEFLALHFG